MDRGALKSRGYNGYAREGSEEIFRRRTKSETWQKQQKAEKPEAGKTGVGSPSEVSLDLGKFLNLFVPWVP